MGQIILILILVLTGVLLVTQREFIKKHHRKIEITLGIILVISRIGRGTEYFIADEYYRIVPLQLCSISTYIALFYFLFNWKQLEKFLFFFGFLGLTAFIDPDVDFSEAVKTFYLYGFTIDHLFITLAPLYLVLIKDFKVQFKDILIPFLTVVVLIFASWLITINWDGSNFFYLVKKPVFSDVFSAPNGDNMNVFYTLHYILWFFIAFFLFNGINWFMIKGVQKLIKE